MLFWAGATPLSSAFQKEFTFVKYLKDYVSPKTDRPLSRQSWKKILQLTSRFYNWAKNHHPNEFGIVPQFWIDSMNIPKSVQENDEKPQVKFAEILKIAKLSFPDSDLASIRDQAAACFLFLSGIRASAFVTLPIKAVNLIEMSVKQWPQLGVLTKNNKSKTTFLFPTDDLLVPIKRWDSFIRKIVPVESPWYTPINNNWGEHSLSLNSTGKNRNQLLNKRLKLLFQKAGLEYKSAHAFRRGNTVFGLKNAKDPADYKAVSENLMHANITVTDGIYAKLSDYDRKTLISNMFQENQEFIDSINVDIIVRKIIEGLKNDHFDDNNP